MAESDNDPNILRQDEIIAERKSANLATASRQRGINETLKSIERGQRYGASQERKQKQGLYPVPYRP
jgi:hypothetical protein